MTRLENNGIIDSRSKQPLSANEQVQSGSGQAQSSSGQPQYRSEQAQSTSADRAIQMLLNKNKIKVENKPVDKEEQKREAEKVTESIRRFNQMKR